MANVTVPATGEALLKDAAEGGTVFPAGGLFFGPAASLQRVLVGGGLPVQFDTPTRALFGALTDTAAADGAVTDKGLLALLKGILRELIETSSALAAPLTASGEFTLSGALPAGGNNIGDVDVVTVPTIATSTRALDYANGVTVTAGAASSASAAIAASEICVHNAGTVRAYIRQGAATPTASVAATSLALEPGEKIWLRHTPGHMVAAIRDGASDCAIRITPVL